MADGAGAGLAASSAGLGGKSTAGRREGRAPVSGFITGQDVYAWHRGHGWIEAVVQSVREDGKYVLVWGNGDETDRIKTRTNLRKGVKDQLKNTKYTGLRDEGPVLAAPAVVGEIEMNAEGAVKMCEMVISGGEVFAGTVDAAAVAPPVAACADLNLPLLGGIKLDQVALAEVGMGEAGLMCKREKRRGMDGEDEEEESQADIHGGTRGAVPPPLIQGGWSRSEHTGLMSMYFQSKRWYHCDACDYLNDRLYHSKMHYERIHVKKGKQQFHKRKHTNSADSPGTSKDDGGSEDDMADDGEDAEGRKNRLKLRKLGKDDVGGGPGQGSKSPIKGAKATGKTVKPHAPLDVLATLVTAEANAKGETGSPMSMKAWLEMQVSLAAKNKLAVAEAAAMDESGRDAKRPKTRGASTAEETSRAAAGGASKKGAAVGKKKGEESSLSGCSFDTAAVDDYQKAYQTALTATSAFTSAVTPTAAAAAMEEYSKAYQMALSATAAMDWSKMPAGVVNPLMLASFAASTPAALDAGANGKGGDDAKSEKGKAAEGGVDGVQATSIASLEGGVAVLLDAMRRHNEEGAKAGAKKGLKGAKGGKTSMSDGEEMVGLDGMTSMDMATATALSALIPPWLLSASGLGGGLLEGGLLGALGALEADMGALSPGKKQQAHEEGGEGSENEDEDMDGKGARGSSKEGASSATDAMHKKQKLEEEEEGGGDTIDTGGVGSGKRDGMEGGEDVSQGKHQEFEATLAAQMAPPAADDGSAFADIAMSMAMAAVSQVPPPPAPPDNSEADEAAFLASIAASQAAANIAAGMAAASAIKNPQLLDPKPLPLQARVASRWPGGLTSEGLVKEPRGKSRREVKNALSEAQKQNLVKIVGDDGTLSRDPELVEAGVLLPLPGGRSDEAILRVDFLFDLATLDGRKKRAHFFKLINGAVGQVGREHSLHNSVVNVIKNMCFMPGTWEPSSATANWKDANCWRFRQEMLKMHVTKMRTEAQARKRSREHPGGEPRALSEHVLSAHSRGEVDMHHRDDGLTRSCGLGLAAGFKEEVRAAVSGMVGASGLGIKLDADIAKAKGMGAEVLGLTGAAGEKLVLGDGTGPGGPGVLGGIGVLLEVAMAKQNNTEGGESSAPPPPPPPPDHTAATAAPLLMDHVAAAVAALAAPEHAMSLATHAMVMDLPIATVGAEALASPSTAAAAAMGSAMVAEQMLPVAAVEMQPVEEYPQEPQDGGGEIDITEDSAVQAEVASNDAALAAAAAQTLDDDEALDASGSMESAEKDLSHSLGDDGAGEEKDGGGVLSFEEDR